ncbi:hypothetical protein RKLH11_1605 [Rhodobacteraceae bacterium KLH11]|nr:hypothetical protein RKLH11_1605 [Rhodobacteraceae bacterium KLH11]
MSFVTKIPFQPKNYQKNIDKSAYYIDYPSEVAMISAFPCRKRSDSKP